MIKKNNQSIFGRLKKGYYWSQTLFYFQEKDYQKAIVFFDKYAMQKKMLTPAEEAFQATLFVGNNESDQAQKKFEKILDGLEVDSDQKMYVRSYSELYLSLITKDDFHKKHLRELKKINISTDIREILPLPEEEVLNF